MKGEKKQWKLLLHHDGEVILSRTYAHRYQAEREGWEWTKNSNRNGMAVYSVTAKRPLLQQTLKEARYCENMLHVNSGLMRKEFKYRRDKAIIAAKQIKQQ